MELKTFNLVVMSLLLLSLILLIVGYVQLNNSVMWGSEKISIYIREQMGGSMDTDRYGIMLQNFIVELRWKGAILLSLGGLASIACILSLLFINGSKLR